MSSLNSLLLRRSIRATGKDFGSLLPARIPQSGGTHYYVAPSPIGNDTTGNGSIGSPWATIQKAFDSVLLAGSIINLRAGTYTDTKNYSQWNRVGDSSNPVTIQSYPGEVAVLSGQRVLVTGSGAYLRIKNLEIKDVVLTQANGIKVEGTAHHIEVVGCYIHDAPRTGILIITGNNLQIWDTIIASCGSISSNQDHGIYWAHGSGVGNVLANTLIYNTSGYNLQLYPDISDLIVTCCTLDDCKNPDPANGRGGMVLGTQSVDQNTSNINIIGMLTTNATTYGVEFWSPDGTFLNNNIYDTLTYGNGSGNFRSSSGIIYTNCTIEDPLYVNQVSRDYRLQAGSPAINKIQPTRFGYVPIHDILGNSRITADAGAYSA